MRLAFILLASLFSLSLFAQEMKSGESKYGIDVKYSYTFLKKKKKKDQYLVVAQATNNSGKNLYYVVNKEAFSDFDLSFARVNVRNTKGLFANTGAFPKGEATPYTTKNGDKIFKIKKGVTYKADNKSSVDKGSTPVITNDFPYELKELKELDVDYLSDPFISTTWTSNCGNFDFNLKFEKVGTDTMYITQYVNGKEFKYQHSGDGLFVRLDNPNYTITYAEDGSNFFYMADDGVTCTWKRKEEME
jgi:hypothetical protein